MSQPFKFTDSDTESNRVRRDPSEILEFKRIVELDTPRGVRPGKLIIVRPLEKIRDFRETDPEMAWKTLVVADIAVLQAVPSMPDEFGQPLPPIAPGAMFRNQIIFQGMLCKAWRDQIGNTLIGVLYYGPNEKGQPPFLWRSLAQVSAATDLGSRFMMRFPQFLIPVPREPEAAAAAEPWASHAQPASQDPWAQPLQAQPVYQQQPPQGHAQPVSTPPAPQEYQPDPWAGQVPAYPQVAQSPPDPWASTGVTPPHPMQGMSTLAQMKAASQNAQGQPQAEDPPF